MHYSPRLERIMRDWLEAGARAYAKGETLNSNPYEGVMAFFFWSKGWEGVEYPEALRVWKERNHEPD